MHTKKVRILVADDHPVVADAVNEHLERHPGFNTFPPVANSTELFERLNVLEVDVLVADYAMPGGIFGDGLTMLKRIREKYPAIRVIVFTGVNSPGIVAALETSGIHSIVSKSDDPDELIIAIDRALRGNGYRGRCIQEQAHQAKCRGGHGSSNNAALSTRETEVLRLYLTGISVSGIADALNRSIKTIYNQKRAAMVKLSCKTDAELFRLQAIDGIKGDHLA